MKKYIFLCGISIFCNNLTLSNPADLDTSFNNGFADNLFVAYSVNSAQDIAVQSDGKIVTAGYAGDNALIVRFNNNGTLDRTFYNGNTGQIPGTVTINLGYNTAAYGVAIQPLDDKIVIAGYVDLPAGYNLFLARYNNDGTLDTSFAGTGYIVTNLGSEYAQLFDVAIDFDGNIVAVGWTEDNDVAVGLIVRYTSDGTPDADFGDGGYKQIYLGTFTRFQALAIQANGQIIVTGQALIDTQELIVLCFQTDGFLNTSFNNNQEWATLPSTYQTFLSSQGYDVAIQPDQKIVVVGSSNIVDGFQNQLYTVLRLNSDGTLDTTFNTPNGYIASEIGLVANSLVIQDNSQIVTCGANYRDAFIVIAIRYNNDGSIDSVFNFEPQTTISLNTIGNAIALQSDGKIIISGIKVVPYVQPSL